MFCVSQEVDRMTKAPDVGQIRCPVTSVHGVPLFLDHIVALYSDRKILGDQLRLIVTIMPGC